MYHRQNEGQNDDIKTEDRSFVDVAMSSYLGVTIRDQNCAQEERNATLNSMNACCH